MLPIQPGSIVIGEYVDNWKKINDGLTYVVLSRHDGIVYKRLFNQVEENGTLTLRSDNTAYPAYPIQNRRSARSMEGGPPHRPSQ